AAPRGSGSRTSCGRGWCTTSRSATTTTSSTVSTCCAPSSRSTSAAPPRSSSRRGTATSGPPRPIWTEWARPSSGTSATSWSGGDEGTRADSRPPTERAGLAALATMTAARDWYKDAVFYEVHVKAFMDGNGDGVGDFVGLTERLDYLAELGVDCLWVLPMYASPLRDDGYDIADFYAVQDRKSTRLNSSHQISSYAVF